MLIAAILICQIIGNIGTLFTYPALAGWYSALHKPSFNPPDWVFGPVWLILYTLMGISLYLAWSSPKRIKSSDRYLIPFWIQLLLNPLWSFLFFGLRSPLYGLIGIAALWITIMITIIRFSRISRNAALLLVPYIFWVSFAIVLNFYVWKLN
ncbi:MAG: tryptophan-rich sensory protein [Candidatus Micrarchaeota archaeon]|nr:tryptophan-rich sensory protein [Candidatus Micrarchaeota archaeon]MDE1849717.1 tryptophan-rich sensory protein [Candidatus Micrarchaeota archaeon]